MKKFFSILLALVMVLGTCVTLVSTASAVESNTIASWNFDSAAGSNEALLNSLGWRVLTNNASNMTAAVENGVLRLRNATTERVYMLVCQDEALTGSYTLQYDFKYAAKSGTYNSDTDQAGFFLGDLSASSAGTWQVQPRLYGKLLSDPKTDSDDWINTGRMNSNTFGTLSDGIVSDQWFTAKIEYSSGNCVTASIMEQGSSVPIVTDVYSNEQIEGSIGTTGFITEYLRFCLGPTVDIYLDNITITAADYAPEIEGLQFKDGDDTYDMRVVSTIRDKSADRVGYRFIITYFDEAKGGFQQKYKDVDCNYVYQSITYMENGVPVTKTANELKSGMSYIYALHLKGVPMGETYTYQIVPYEVRGGEVIYGKGITYDRSLVKEKLPTYDTASGTVNDFVEFCAGGYYTRQVVGTDTSELSGYVTKLKAAGYEEYQTRSANENHFLTLCSDESMVHLYYMPAANTGGDFTKDVVRIVISDTPATFSTTPYGDDRVTEGSTTLMALNYAGQHHGKGYTIGLGVVFTNPDGSYVIVDGGWDADTEILYRYLKNNNKREDGKVVIRAWILTHPHEDHWGNIVEFAARYAGETVRCEEAGCIANDGQIHDYSDVTVEYLVAQLNPQYCASSYRGSAVIYEAAARLGAETIVPQTGQQMYFGELNVEFLYTLETLLNPDSMERYHTYVDGNEQSLIFRAKFAEGQSVLITGDMSKEESEHVDAMYDTHLKSDFVQVAHHALNESTDRFYDTLVKALYVMVPTSTHATVTRYGMSKRDGRIGGIHEAIDYALANNGAFFAADGGYATFNIESGFSTNLKTQIKDTNKDSITFAEFFQ